MQRRGTQHFRAAGSARELHPDSAALLLFYAVECALKAALIRRRSGHSTSDLPDEYRTHDVGRLAKELRFPPGHEPKPNYRLSRTGDATASIPVERLHEAWRYGRDLVGADMDDARVLLERLYELAERDSRK